MRNKEITVCVAGGFDPIHSGHIDHIKKAKALGNKLIVITHSDEILERKKGYYLIPLKDRIAVLEALRDVDEVIVSIDKDGTVAQTLAQIKPDIFAKGGDRNPKEDPIPNKEVEVCEAIGCRIEYGIGEQLNSSSRLVEICKNKLQGIKTG